MFPNVVEMYALNCEFRVDNSMTGKVLSNTVTELILIDKCNSFNFIENNAFPNLSTMILSDMCLEFQLNLYHLKHLSTLAFKNIFVKYTDSMEIILPDFVKIISFRKTNAFKYIKKACGDLLNIDKNQITSLCYLDNYKFNNIWILNCMSNEFVINNTHVRNIKFNKMTFNNVAINCPKVKNIIIQGKSKINSLSIHCPNTRFFNSSDNQISHLSITSQKYLEIYAILCELKTIHLNTPNLFKLAVNDNNLSSIDLTNFNKLSALSISRNNIEELIINSLEIERIIANSNKLKILKINSCSDKYSVVTGPKIDILEISSNHLTTLKIVCPKLTILEAHHNKIYKVEFSFCGKLEILNLEFNQIFLRHNIVIPNNSNSIKKLHARHNPCFKKTNRLSNWEVYIKWIESKLSIDYCLVCMRRMYDYGISLNCKHTYCYNCIENLISKPEKLSQCTICKKDIIFAELLGSFLDYRSTYPDHPTVNNCIDLCVFLQKNIQ